MKKIWFLSFIVLLSFFLLLQNVSLTKADDLTVTHAYSLYSGSVSVDFSPDGKYIATGDTDGDIGFWAVGDDDAMYVDLGGEVEGVAFSPDGNYLAADGYNGSPFVWLLDVAPRTTVNRSNFLDDAGNINSIAYSADGSYVAVAADLKWAFLWDVNSDQMRGWGKGSASEVYDVAFSPDGRYLAAGDDAGYVSLYALDSWWADVDYEDVNVIDFTPGGNVQSVAFSPDGRYLAADGYDGSNTYVNIYDMTTSNVAWQLSSGNVYAIAFSPNGEYIALGDGDGVISFYKIGTNPTLAAEITASGEVLDLAWSPDGTMISDGRDVWNVNQPNTTADANGIALEVPSYLISEVAFAPNATYFVLNAMYPRITGVANDEVYYGDCTITLDFEGVPANTLSDNLLPSLLKYLGQIAIGKTVLEIAKGFAEDHGLGHVFSDRLQYFIFSLQEAAERSLEAEEEKLSETRAANRSGIVGLILYPENIPYVGSVINWAADLSTIQYNTVVEINRILTSMMDPEIRLTKGQILLPGPGRPTDRDRYVLLLPKPVAEIKPIRVTVKQVYRLESDKQQDHTVTYEGTYNLEAKGFAAPSRQLTTLSDYPPFQLLSEEVQTFLLHYFSTSMDAIDRPLPERTVLLPNYPNPFNPETWLPYELSAAADVSISIYAADGRLVRTLDLGHQAAGTYESRGRAAYWDGRNALGEVVASGVYFYTLTAGDFSATRKMLIRK